MEFGFFKSDVAMLASDARRLVGRSLDAIAAPRHSRRFTEAVTAASPTHTLPSGSAARPSLGGSARTSLATSTCTSIFRSRGRWLPVPSPTSTGTT